MREWSFAFDDARRITQATLAVIGQKSAELDRIWVERHELLLAWLPNVEPFVLRDAGHLLSVENPRGMAEGLAAFFASQAVRILLDDQGRSNEDTHRMKVGWEG